MNHSSFTCEIWYKDIINILPNFVFSMLKITNIVNVQNFFNIISVGFWLFEIYGSGNHAKKFCNYQFIIPARFIRYIDHNHTSKFCMRHVSCIKIT
jgi:hypothetical protein